MNTFTIGSVAAYNRDQIFYDTPLFTAIRNKNHGTMQELISMGADVDERQESNSCSQFSPLHVMAAQWDVEGIRLLVNAGADLTAPDRFGYSPLVVALDLETTGIQEDHRCGSQYRVIRATIQ